MNLETAEEKKIVSYLLGDLSEDEQDRLEVRYFAEPEYREAIRSVEDDLVDEYVRGELSPDEERRFADLFVASPERTRQIAFARALAQATVGTAPTVPAALKESIKAWWTILLVSPRSPWPAFQVALVVGVVVLGAAFLWLLIEASRLRSQVSELIVANQVQQENERTAHEQIAQQRANSDELAAQLNQEQAERQASAERLKQLQAERDRLALEQRRDSTSRSSTIASFVLSPGMVRSTNNEPDRLRVPGNIGLINLRLDIESGDEYPRYRAELRTVGGNLVWSADQLRLQRTRSGQSVVLNVPANLLTPGEYELTLRGVTGPGEFLDIGYYYFSIIRP